MSELFILQNDEQLFLSKQNAWVDGRDLNQLYKSPYKDEAINQMVEVSSKDFRQRIKVLSCSANDKGLPQLEPEWLPEPLPKVVKDLFEATEPPLADGEAVASAANDDGSLESGAEITTDSDDSKAGDLSAD
jgi:hypothetical protein